METLLLKSELYDKIQKKASFRAYYEFLKHKSNV